MNPSHVFLGASLALVPMLGAPMLGAQAPTYRWSPTGTDQIVGGRNNTIPFWSTSATYQQIHEARDFGETTVAMKGMAMRPWGDRTLTGRSWDMRITLSQTLVTAANATIFFNSNLLGTNTKTVFATNTTFSKFSWPTSTSTRGKSVVNPPTFTIPFNATYTYTPAAGNLCWEWRYRDATTNSPMQMDAVGRSTQRGTILPNVGKGCTVAGNTVPATAAMDVISPITGVQHLLRAVLSNAPKSNSKLLPPKVVPALLAIGLTKQKVNLGWCTTLETVPLVFAFGQTDNAGAWVFEAPMSLLQSSKSISIYVQYAFPDAGQLAGLGLSDLAGYTTPALPGAHGMTRIFDAPASGKNGSELATTGNVDRDFGLVVGWLQ